MRFALAAAALTMAWSSTAMSANVPVLQPTESWALDYGDSQCTAARSFGDRSAPVVLAFVPSLTANSDNLVVSVPQEGPAFARVVRGSIDFGRGPVSTDILYYGQKHVKQSAYQLRLSAADLAALASAPSVSVHAGNANYAFALSDMPALTASLAKCSADLQQYWNSDGRNIRNPARMPSGDIRSLFSKDDYPTEALKRESQGRPRGNPAQFQLLVNEKGAVGGCSVLTPSGDPVLDSTFCDVISQRAKFTPATGSQGQAVRSVVTTPVVTWADDSALNSGCTWYAGNTSGVINNCGIDPAHAFPVAPLSPPPPPPPPPPTQN